MCEQLKLEIKLTTLCPDFVRARVSAFHLDNICRFLVRTSIHRFHICLPACLLVRPPAHLPADRPTNRSVFLVKHIVNLNCFPLMSNSTSLNKSYFLKPQITEVWYFLCKLA